MLTYSLFEICLIQWHPSKPLVIAVGLDTGTIYQWSTTVTEGWSAFAPDFIELDENRVYEEREDEFDIVCPFLVYLMARSRKLIGHENRTTTMKWLSTLLQGLVRLRRKATPSLS
jgi:hypothetical protein